MELPFSIKESKPSKALEPYIKRWIFFSFDGDDNYLHQVAPTGTLFFNHAYQGGHPKIIIGEQEFTNHPKSIFVGHPVRNDIAIEYHPGIKLVFIEFTYTGFYSLFHIPASSLQDQGVDISVFGHEKLAKALHSLKHAETIKDILEAYLIKRIPNALKTPKDVLDIIEKLESNMTQPLLSNKDSNAKKRLNRLFKKHVGLTIKKFQRVYQLNTIIRLMNENNLDSLTELAYQAGYYDQADFIKHIRHYLSHKPSQLINQRKEVLFQFMGRN